MSGLFGALAAGLERKLYAFDPDIDPTLRGLIEYPETKSGVSVNWKKALRVTAFLAGVRCLANGVSQVPLKLFKPTPDGRGANPATDHPLYNVLFRRPNPWQTSFDFRQTLMFHKLLAGGFFAFKNVVDGAVKELIPFEPGWVEIIRNRDLSLTYRVSIPGGTSQDFPQDAIWHLRGSSWDTYRGIDIVKEAREAIGLSIATERSQALMHKNGMRSTGLFSVDGNLTADQYLQLRGWIADQIGGDNAFLPFLLDRRADFKPMTLTGLDAQSLETRNFQIEESCRAIGINPVMVGHSGNSRPTFASAEQFFLNHVVHGLGPHYAEIEQSIDVNLIGENEDVYARFIDNALLRGASADRATFYSKALGAGGSPAWMSPNEVRGLEELNPKDGGDELPKGTPPGSGGGNPNDENKPPKEPA